MLIDKKIIHIVNISFVLPYYIGDQFDFFADKGVKFYVGCTPDGYLDQFTSRKNIVPVPLNILREINLREDLLSIIKLYKLIKKEKIDIVITHTPKGGLIGIIASFFARIDKRIYFRHGLVYETSSGLKRVLLKNIERLTGFLSTKVICVSDSVLKISLLEKLSRTNSTTILNMGTCNGIDAEKTFNLKNIDQASILFLKQKYNINDTDFVIGFVGRLVNDKGVNELIGAWKNIIITHRNVKLLLVGPFEKRDGLNDEIKEFIGNEPSIIHTGLIEDVRSHYALMNIFILPSYREGFPTVVLEASAMELPIITTRVTGCCDSIISNQTGIFTELENEHIAKSILYYMSNKQLAIKHGQNGRKFVIENFNQQKIWEEIQKILEE